jgi:hypothetical protein
MDTIKADYFAETGDEKVAGTIIVKANTVVALYSLPGYSKRTMLLTEQGLKFCIKGKPSDFSDGLASTLLQEATN